MFIDVDVSSERERERDQFSIFFQLSMTTTERINKPKQLNVGIYGKGHEK